MRIYLVVIDDSPESRIALRFAARRAVKTGGGVEILTLLPPQEFIAFGGVQATIEDEARQQAERCSPARRVRSSTNRVCARRSRCARATGRR
ncbi:Universal stress protein family [Sphingomonas paucimobilis]|nr:Universal stress protein family [Sphingomonas paucimobilis]